MAMLTAERSEVAGTDRPDRGDFRETTFVVPAIQYAVSNVIIFH